MPFVPMRKLSLNKVKRLTQRAGRGRVFLVCPGIKRTHAHQAEGTPSSALPQQVVIRAETHQGKIRLSAATALGKLLRWAVTVALL